MGIIQKPLPVKLFLAIMYHNEKDRDKSLKVCSESFGAVELIYGPLNVNDYTTYYDKDGELSSHGTIGVFYKPSCIC